MVYHVLEKQGFPGTIVLEQESGRCMRQGGMLLLSMRKPAAMLALLCLLGVISGRIVMVAAGLYPVTTPLQVGSVIIGTTTAAVFALYLWMRRKSFE
jgi:hypothetical protein